MNSTPTEPSASPWSSAWARSCGHRSLPPGVATMVFFAFVDPLQLAEISFPDWTIGRELGYTVGFFTFWLCTASSSLFTWILLGPPSRRRRESRD